MDTIPTVGGNWKLIEFHLNVTVTEIQIKGTGKNNAGEFFIKALRIEACAEGAKSNSRTTTRKYLLLYFPYILM